MTSTSLNANELVTEVSVLVSIMLMSEWAYIEPGEALEIMYPLKVLRGNGPNLHRLTLLAILQTL